MTVSFRPFALLLDVDLGVELADRPFCVAFTAWAVGLNVRTRCMAAMGVLVEALWGVLSALAVLAARPPTRATHRRRPRGGRRRGLDGVACVILRGGHCGGGAACYCGGSISGRSVTLDCAAAACERPKSGRGGGIRVLSQSQELDVEGPALE